MIVALACIEAKNNDINHNLQIILECIEASREVDIIFFGEAVLNGFDSLSFNYQEDLKQSLALNSKAVTKIKAKAKECNVYVGVGLYKQEKGNISDCYLIIDNKGMIVADHDRTCPCWKINDFDNSHYIEGNIMTIVEIFNRKFAIAICGELWNESYFSQIKESNADYVVWPLFVQINMDEFNKSIKKEYLDLMINLDKKLFIINSLHQEKNSTNGGAAYFDERVVYELPMQEDNILVFKLKK